MSKPNFDFAKDFKGEFRESIRLIEVVNQNRKTLAMMLGIAPAKINKLLGLEFKASKFQTKELKGLNSRLCEALRLAADFRNESDKKLAYKKFKRIFNK